MNGMAMSRAWLANAMRAGVVTGVLFDVIVFSSSVAVVVAFVDVVTVLMIVVVVVEIVLVTAVVMVVGVELHEFWSWMIAGALAVATGA